LASSESPGSPLRVSFGKNRYAIPAFLTVPDRAVAGLLDFLDGKPLVGRLELLQADDVGTGGFEPAQQDRQPAFHAVDVETRDLHRDTLPISISRPSDF
jgi:hypothetical protein